MNLTMLELFVQDVLLIFILLLVGCLVCLAKDVLFHQLYKLLVHVFNLLGLLRLIFSMRV